jgi:hypothetical protein
VDSGLFLEMRRHTKSNTLLLRVVVVVAHTAVAAQAAIYRVLNP